MGPRASVSSAWLVPVDEATHNTQPSQRDDLHAKDNMTQTGCQIVLTTCPDVECARQLANVLVDEGLAACVNIVPGIQSVYRWQGNTETANENLLLIKSVDTQYDAIEHRIRDLHPYELPEIVAVPLSTGLAQYLAWRQQPE